MTNGNDENLGQPWVDEYHHPDLGSQMDDSSVTETPGNCTRCGKPLPSHDDQMEHSLKEHI